ncbi:MAG: NEW3 domain-containing protein [Armatimonadota bacterium]|nr:NEW3 domain-containing protein [Armatimonadota bacterium]MDR5697049.1 NEW3 domain-containing protein [Armatimonadota bacterium]
MRLLATALAVGMVLVGTAGVAGAPAFRGLAISTPYPSQTVRGGEPVVINLTVRNFGLPPQVVSLRMAALAPGWRATFLAGGRVVSAVYVLPDQEASVTLRLDPPSGLRTGTHTFRVVATGQQASAELPLRLTLGQVLPVRLALEAEQPAVRGPATATFRYRVQMRNESDQDLLVQLSAQAPQRFQVTFTALGQQVTSVPVRAGESRDIDVEVSMPQETPANTYHIEVRASAGDTLASVRLAAEVTGRPDLQITAPEGRLSGRAYAGQETPLKIIVRNNGSAPVRNLTLTSSAPSGWDVRFDPERIDEVAPRQEVEVTARMRPSPRAISGDYMVTITASGGEASASADFRITVLTRTVWGIVGVVLIAAALLVVGQAVARYGRR